MTVKRPKAPKDLGAAGRELWDSILGDLPDDWTLDARELHSLKRACRCEDEMVALERAVDRGGETTTGSRGQIVVHPALGEARQLRLVQLRLLSVIEMENPDAKKESSPASSRARSAANARWRHRDQLQARRVRHGTA